MLSFCKDKESNPAIERNLMMQKSAIVEIELQCMSLCKPQATLYYPRFFCVQLLLLKNNAVAKILLIFIPFIISLCFCTSTFFFRYGMR